MPSPSSPLPPLQPLRVPAGWFINWNTLEETDAVDAEGGAFGGSSLFMATHEQMRYRIDVEWRPEFDPDGSYHLTVEYAAWERSERGRRRSDVPLSFGAAELVHRFETRSRVALVQELNTWLWRGATEVREGH